jgi:two-component system, OmpR family, alkaline phosphatase synthesis response regulator PhoP
MSTRILLTEDEENLREIIALNLEMEGYDVTLAKDGKEALEKYAPGRFHLIILDVMLPEISGFQLCESIRKQDKHIPVLFLTAKNESEDRIRGLKLGADDYLTKPFNLEELLLRVKNLLKRLSKEIPENSNKYTIANKTVDFLTYEVVDDSGVKFNLSNKEIKLLKLLIEKKNQVVSRDEILDKVWGSDAFPSSRTIDNFILVFRKYFEENPKEAKFFHSVRGVGYKFTD